MRPPRPIPASPGPVLSVSSAASGDDAALAPLIAANLAAYLRALHDGLPLFFASFSPAGAGAFPALDATAPDVLPTLDAGWKSGSLNASIALGIYGIHYVRAPESRAALSAAADVAAGGRPLREVLDRTRWTGLHVLDVRGCEEGAAHAAEAASQRLILPVHDLASLERARLRLESDARAAEVGRLLISGVDRGLRVSADGGDALGALRDEIGRRGLPSYEAFLSRAPEVEARLMAGSARRSVLHAAPDSVLHRQFRAVAEEVSRDLGLAAYDRVPEVAEATAVTTAAWRRLILARKPRSLGDSSSRTRTARPVRAVADTLIRKGAQ